MLVRRGHPERGPGPCIADRDAAVRPRLDLAGRLAERAVRKGQLCGVRCIRRGRNGVDVLVDRIKDTWRAKLSIIRPSSREVIAATSVFTSCIDEGGLTWYRPQTVLNESAMTATKRPIAGGFGLGGDNSLPVEACALALWGAKTCKRDPTREMRIG